jgi:hypothetical protein
MVRTVQLRDAQIALGAAYLVVAVLAFARRPEPVSLAACVVVGAFSYLTGVTCAPARIPLRELWRAVGLGVLVLAVASTVAGLGPRSWMLWVPIAMAYCCGNRLRAGALFGG